VPERIPAFIVAKDACGLQGRRKTACSQEKSIDFLGRFIRGKGHDNQYRRPSETSTHRCLQLNLPVQIPLAAFSGVPSRRRR
jgi:hypothetical protein